MIPPVPQWNDPLGARQVPVVLASISTYRKDIEALESLIIQQELKSTGHATSISHLEPTISWAKLALRVQEENLDRLERAKDSLGKLFSTSNLESMDSSAITESCDDAISVAQAQIKADIETFSGQILALKKLILSLKSTTRELQQGLYGQQLLQLAALEHVKGLSEQKTALERSLQLLRLGVSARKLVPEEIWADIFSFSVQMDMEEYFKEPVDHQLTRINFRLSQVCQFWRRVASSEKALWQFAEVYADDDWPLSKIELLEYSCGTSSWTPTLICNLSTYRPWDTLSYTPFGCPTPINEAVTAMSTVYSMQIFTAGDNDMSDPSRIPPFRVDSLTVQILPTSEGDAIERFLNHFSELKKLVVICRKNTSPLSISLPASVQALTYVKLDLTNFESLDPAGYLGPNVVEFHILHYGLNKMSPSAPLQLPKLKVIGLTPPDTAFTNSLELPGITTVFLYGPKLPSIPSVSLADFANSLNFQKARVVELRGWHHYHPTDGIQWGIMNSMDGVIDSMRSVTTLKCIDSYIDGQRLVDLVKKLKDTTNNVKGSLLESVIIDCCSGITRADCEVIGGLVGKLEVYI